MMPKSHSLPPRLAAKSAPSFREVAEGAVVVIAFRGQHDNQMRSRNGVVRRVSARGLQVECTDSLPYPARWEFQRLELGGNVRVKVGNKWFEGELLSAGGKRLHLQRLRPVE